MCYIVPACRFLLWPHTSDQVVPQEDLGRLHWGLHRHSHCGSNTGRHHVTLQMDDMPQAGESHTFPLSIALAGSAVSSETASNPKKLVKQCVFKPHSLLSTALAVSSAVDSKRQQGSLQCHTQQLACSCPTYLDFRLPAGLILGQVGLHARPYLQPLYLYPARPSRADAYSGPGACPACSAAATTRHCGTLGGPQDRYEANCYTCDGAGCVCIFSGAIW